MIEMDERITQLKELVKSANLLIDMIQDTCDHPVEAVTKKADANTGNWDRNDDIYWYNFYCEKCDKRWTVYSNTDEYRTQGIKYTRIANK